ncbi:MAG TPA: hypothetical protein VL068_03605, partial [Microthrixaceae bacterium]|nr:hypothetical protein [Microthrixaceae bacterium]
HGRFNFPSAIRLVGAMGRDKYASTSARIMGERYRLSLGGVIRARCAQDCWTCPHWTRLG